MNTSRVVLASPEEYRGKLFQLHRAIEGAAAYSRSLVSLSECATVATESLSRLSVALEAAQAAMGEVRLLDGRTAMLDRALRIFRVDLVVGNGSGWGVEEFERCVDLGASASRSTNVKVSAAARVMQLSRRALCRRMHEGGFPTARRSITWGQILRAMYLHAVEGLPLHQAAWRSGFHDGFALSSALDRFAGIRPLAWREAGADFDDLCRRFVETWRGEQA